jgi:protein involved in temperature-dependent protein secretion
MTDWRELGENLYWGLGLRLFLVDGEDKTLFEATPVEFNVAQAKAEPVGTTS